MLGSKFAQKVNLEEKKKIIELFEQARKDESLVILEGFHPLKHALRFGAHILHAYTENLADVLSVAESLAADITGDLENKLKEIPKDIYQRLSPRPLSTGIIAIADRPKNSPKNIGKSDGLIVYLDNPRNLKNVGAVIRVAAAAGAAAVVTNGEVNPWHPICVRASAGLHFALPVIRTENAPPAFGQPVIVFDPAGRDLQGFKMPEDCVLVFGSERRGVSQSIKENADKILRIPMKEKVSSLNLATSVAVALYHS